MKQSMILAVFLGLSLAIPGFAAEDPITKGLQGALDTFATGCQQELTTFCKDVEPGEGRIIACLYRFPGQTLAALRVCTLRLGRPTRPDPDQPVVRRR